jgi:hypothetical protein
LLPSFDFVAILLSPLALRIPRSRQEGRLCNHTPAPSYRKRNHIMAINTFAFAADADRRTNIAERGAAYLVTPAFTSPLMRAEEIARVAERAAVDAATRGPRQVSSFWQAPAAPAAPPAA